MELTLDQALQKGIEAHKAGKIQEADHYYTAILKANPKHPDANHNLGVLAVGVGKVEAALPFYKTALEANPKIDQYWLSYIEALIKLDQMDDAKSVYDQAKRSGAKGDGFDHIEKWLGSSPSKNSDTQEPPQKQLQSLTNLCSQGQFQEALDKGSQLLKQFPKAFTLYNIVGTSNQGLGNLEESIEAYTKALSIKPDYAEAHYNMGNALKDQGKLNEAIEAYTKALSIKPDLAEAHYNMGNALKNQAKLDEAIEAYTKALSIKPDYSSAYNNLGNALKDQGNLDKALEAYTKALSIKPDYANAYSNMGITFKDQGELDKAIEAYRKVLSIKPDFAEGHENLSLVLLNSGKLKEGLDEYEWRWKTAKRVSINRHFSKPLWDGKESLKGKKILLWSEQGVGDTINWSSGLSYVASIAEHCILECQKKLVSLLARSHPNVEVKPENRSLDAQRDDFDFHLPMGSLYRHFISEISQDSKAKAFLIPDPVRVRFWRDRLNSLGNGPYIGISWKSSNMSSERIHNYAPIPEFSPVLNIPGATFINLQYSDFENDLTKIKDELGVKVHNFDDLDQFENLEDVAALSAALDIVVSTHNVVVMIAPWVGTPTKFASWRQSPYNNVLLAPRGPSLDTFERNTWEPWENIFRSIAKDIIDNF